MARPIFVEIVGSANQFKKELEGAVASTSKANSGFARMGKAAGVAGLALGGVLAVGLEKSVKAAEAMQVSTARMDAAFKTAHVSSGAFAGAIGKAEGASRRLGFENAAVRDSLGSLVIATHSGSKAISDLSVAEDIARFKHVDLSTATKMLTMAQAGSQRATKQLGIDVPKVTSSYDDLKATMGKTIDAHEKMELAAAKVIDKQKTENLVIATVSEKLHGQADAYSSTAAGGMAQFHAQIGNLEEKMGTGLLPILAKVADALSTVADYLSKHTTLAKGLVIGLGALAAAFLSVSVAAWIAANAMTLGIAGGVTVAVAGAVLLVKHWDEVKAAFERIWDWIDSHWPLVGAMLAGPVGFAVAEIATHIGAIKRAFTDAGNDIVGFFTRLPGRIGDAITSGAAAIKSAVTGLFGKVIDWVKGALGISSPSAVFMEIGKNVVEGFVKGVGSMAGVLKDAVVGLAEKYVSGPISKVGGIVGAAPAGGSFTAGSTVGLGKLMAAGRGWTGGEWNALYNLWQGESGWSATAFNRMSGAQGIPQFLPMPGRVIPKGFPNNPPIDAAAQITWGLDYIKNRYGDPEHAYRSWLSRSPHWYDQGGWLQPGLTMALNRTGRPEIVTPSDSWVQLRDVTKSGWVEVKAAVSKASDWVQVKGAATETAVKQGTETVKGLLAKIAASTGPLAGLLGQIEAMLQGMSLATGSSSSPGSRSTTGSRSSGGGTSWIQAPASGDGWIQVPDGNGGWVRIPDPGGGLRAFPMANGGIVNSPRLALIGERGPEAVMPLGRGMGNLTVNINVGGSVVSEGELVDKVRREFYRIQKRNTSLGFR